MGQQIYLVKIYNQDEKFLKLGFTKYKIHIRFKDLKYKYKIIRTLRIRNARLIEESIHRSLKDKRYVPYSKFVGYTECYPVSMIGELGDLMKHFKSQRK